VVHGARIRKTEKLVKNYRRKKHENALGKPRNRWKNNIKIDLKVVVCDDVDRIKLAWEKVEWRAFLNTIMNLWVL
jgi:hypothetical protein